MPQATDDTGVVAPTPYYARDPRSTIRGFVLQEMLRGAGYAAAVVLTIGVSLWVIYLLGLLLPEDSKFAPPPMPYSSVQTVSLPAQV